MSKIAGVTALDKETPGVVVGELTRKLPHIEHLVAVYARDDGNYYIHGSEMPKATLAALSALLQATLMGRMRIHDPENEEM